MNILLVDDQKAVVESLKRGIRWDDVLVEHVYTACSAKEAKLVLMNFHVDVLISDIEMPEEDGLSLCRWARKQFPEIECIFLTSHAEFEYAKEAIRIGGFDYILQPVKYTEIEQVLIRVQENIRSKKRIQQLEKTQKIVIDQKNTILDAMLSKADAMKMDEANLVYGQYQKMFQMEYENYAIYPILVQILKWKKITREWEESLIRMTLCNIAEELFSEQSCKAGISCLRGNRYWIFLSVEQSRTGQEIFIRKLENFYQFIEEHMDFSVAIYPGAEGQCFSDAYMLLKHRAEQNTHKKQGIFFRDCGPEAEAKEDPIEFAVGFIRRNLSKNISRADVAGTVHLSEEYFSRLFRQETGDTFKDFVLMEKMKEAKKLLAGSRLSVSIVASKVGYDNFSYFSKVFKKVTGCTPQEYRKENQK